MNNRFVKFYSFLILLSVLMLNYSCADKKKEQTDGAKDAPKTSFEDLKNMKKIDIHGHYRYDREYLVPLLDSMNMKVLTIDVVKQDSGKVKRFWKEYKGMYDKYRNTFFLCTGFNALDIDNPEYANNVIASLKKEISEGATVVKVWKNFGMVIRDKAGNHVQIDDPRLQPIWDFLVEEKIPVMAHIAEPLQAWLPLDDDSPHAGYYRRFPQYHAYLHPDKIPSYDTIINARDRWIERNPKLTIMGAHLGSMAHDVDEVAKRLDKYPNFYVELGARFGDLVRQDSKKVAAFFNKYQDRILYGSDLATFNAKESQSDEANKREEDNIRLMYEVHWRYLTKGDNGDNFDYGDLPDVYKKQLDLSEEVLRKVYYDNAVKFLKLKTD